MEGRAVDRSRNAGYRDIWVMMPDNAQHPTVWGRMADEGRTAIVVCFMLPDRTLSLPYHTLVRWEFSIGETEILTIFGEGVRVTVRGRRLVLLRDGLDQARLEQVRAQGERAALRAAPGEPWIQGIGVETK